MKKDRDEKLNKEKPVEEKNGKETASPFKNSPLAGESGDLSVHNCHFEQITNNTVSEVCSSDTVLNGNNPLDKNDSQKPFSLTGEPVSDISLSSSPQKYTPISPYSKTVAVLLFYFILILVVFRPLFLNFNNLTFQVLGDDFYFWQWRAWMSGELFTTFLDAKPFNLGNLLYFGVFANSGYPEVGNVFDLLFISYPLSKLISFPAFHNVKCILFMLFNGWAAYFAINRLTKNYGAAVVCGIFMIFNPHTMMMINISRLRASLLGFMILFIYYFYMFYIKPTWKNAVLSGIFLAISSLFYWFHGIFLVWTALVMIIVKIFTIIKKSGKKNRSANELDNSKKQIAGGPLPPAENNTDDSIGSAPGSASGSAVLQNGDQIIHGGLKIPDNAMIQGDQMIPGGLETAPTGNITSGSDLLRNGEKQKTADNTGTQWAEAPSPPTDNNPSLQRREDERKGDKNSLFPFIIKTVLIFAILAAVFIPFYIPYSKQTVPMQMDDVKFFINFPPLQEGLQQHRDFLNKDGFPWLAVRLILSDSSTLKFHFSFLFMIAALFAFKGKRKFAFFMLAVFIFFSLLSYGPYLKLSAKQDLGEFAMLNGNSISMPYKFFFKYIPPTARLQHPNRFLSMGAIALMFLGGMGLSNLFNLLKKTSLLKYLLFILVVPGMLLAVPSRTPDLYRPSICNTMVPRIYKDLGKDNENYGIVEFPYQNNLDRISFYQTFHHKKSPGTMSVNLFNDLRELPNGWLKYMSGSISDFEQSNFNRFIKESFRGKDAVLTVEDIREIKKMGYRYIILHEWDFPFEGEKTDSDVRKRKQSYVKTRQKLEDIAGKPARYWELRHKFILQDIPIGTWVEAFEISVFRLDDI